MNFSVFCLLLFLWGSASETSGLVILYLSLLCFFTHLLKFYSGGAVDLWLYNCCCRLRATLLYHSAQDGVHKGNVALMIFED